MREAEKLTPRQEEARAAALARKGHALQQQWNRRRSQRPPGRDPTTRGIGPADQAEARRHAPLREMRVQAYLDELRAAERVKQIVATKEAKIAQQVAEYEQRLRQKAGLPER